MFQHQNITFRWYIDLMQNVIFKYNKPWLPIWTGTKINPCCARNKLFRPGKYRKTNTTMRKQLQNDILSYGRLYQLMCRQDYRLKALLALFVVVILDSSWQFPGPDRPRWADGFENTRRLAFRLPRTTAYLIIKSG